MDDNNYNDEYFNNINYNIINENDLNYKNKNEKINSVASSYPVKLYQINLTVKIIIYKKIKKKGRT